MNLVRIARHGETTWNAIGRYQGRLDTRLSRLGKAQAQALADALVNTGITSIISSPLSRCVETAAPLARRLGVSIHTDPLLLEIDHGAWQGRYRDEIARTEPELYRRWREHPETVRFSGGESLADVFERWKRFVSGFVVDADTLLVTHDIVVRAAVLERTGRGLAHLRTVRALNACYAQFEVEGGCWSLQAECVSEHLKTLTADPERQAL